MKAIGSVKEDLIIEKRISVTPETIKKFTDLKLSVFLEKNYGEHLGIDDKEYKKVSSQWEIENKASFQDNIILVILRLWW